jgi:hypothetical protein
MDSDKSTNDRTPPHDDCVIPPIMSPDVASTYVLNRVEHEEYAIRDYMEWQAPEEAVLHAEKLHSETVLGCRVDVWDVHTDKGRWWVLTNPTNLYSQEHFPSMDYLLSFHVGLMARVAERNERSVPYAWGERASGAWRRWEQAIHVLDDAKEAEDFQAVGMRCRECLLDLVRSVAEEDMVQSGQPIPKLGDFVHWSEIIAHTIAQGASAERVRGYLKANAKATWELVNWLTHSRNASFHHARLAIDATQSLMGAFTDALLRHETGAPDRCPRCDSYQLVSDYQPESGTRTGFVALCSACGWVSGDATASDESEVHRAEDE